MAKKQTKNNGNEGRKRATARSEAAVSEAEEKPAEHAAPLKSAKKPQKPADEKPETGAPEKSEGELEKATALAEDYKRKWYAVSAEYDNYRKRNQTATSKAYADGVAEAVLKILPVADNFGYALDSAQDEKTRAGIDKVIKSFLNILQSMGIEEIPIAAGDPFDESVAEAVLNFPCGEGETPNTVKQVLKKGYRSGDKVIRFAQVAVVGEN